MSDHVTMLFGIPVPSDNPLFLAIVVVHILLGTICVLSGFVAMLATKGKGIHTSAGRVYYWGLALVVLTVIPLSIMRWPHNNHLLLLGITSFSFAHAGRRLAISKATRWARLHTVCMGLSYIILMTAFYVDNGKNLPFWNRFPQLFFWLFPAVFGIPIVIYALLRHPLNRGKL